MTFRKSRPNAPHGFFRAEAAGLAWLAEAGAVRVAAVRGLGDDFIEVERLRAVPPTIAAASAFGTALVRLHDAGAGAFGVGPDGWSGDGWIGDAPLSLATEPTWGRFYARHRLEPYLAAARLGGDGAAVLAALCERLEAGDFDDDAPPARVHGDLWAGNVLFTADGVALIDPAAHGGHRVSDLAMLALFGAPHLAAILAAYEEASTWLAPTWREAIPLHQVHPLLVHAVLFGGGYRDQAVAAARRALSM